MANAWLIHLKQFWAKNKGKMSYKQAMKSARATYKKGGAKAEDAPKKKRRRRKKKSS